MIDRIIQFVRYKWWLIVLVGIGIVGFFAVSGYGTLEIKVTNAKPGEPSVQLLNQRGGGVEEFNGTQGSFSKTVRKSNYEVTVKQSATSGFAVTKTTGFFTKTIVEITLAEMAGKEYVGNEPNSCIIYPANVLYSYDCTGSSYVTAHQPATDYQPTYNLKKELNIGTIEGIVNTKEGLVALAQFRDEEEGDATKHNYYLLDNQLNVIKTVVASALNEETQYKIKSYGDGFIVYDDTFSGAFLNKSMADKSQEIKLGETNENASPGYVETSGNSALFVYYKSAGTSENKTIDMVKIYDGKSVSNVSLKKPAETVSLCGKNILCGLEDVGKGYSDDNAGKLSVYSTIEGLDLLYSIDNVIGYRATESRLGVIRPGNILSVEPATGKGYILFSSDNSSICDLHTQKDNFLVCITNSGGRSSILKLDTTKANDNIDNKISELEDMGEISDVLIYGSKIFISANFGDLVYVDSVGGSDYDPSVKSATASVINKKVDELGLRKAYSVTITGL